jgi:hypothetical protein
MNRIETMLRRKNAQETPTQSATPTRSSQRTYTQEELTRIIQRSGKRQSLAQQQRDLEAALEDVKEQFADIPITEAMVYETAQELEIKPEYVAATLKEMDPVEQMAILKEHDFEISNDLRRAAYFQIVETLLRTIDDYTIEPLPTKAVAPSPAKIPWWGDLMKRNPVATPRDITPKEQNRRTYALRTIDGLAVGRFDVKYTPSDLTELRVDCVINDIAVVKELAPALDRLYSDLYTRIRRVDLNKRFEP